MLVKYIQNSNSRYDETNFMFVQRTRVFQSDIDIYHFVTYIIIVCSKIVPVYKSYSVFESYKFYH